MLIMTHTGRLSLALPLYLLLVAGCNTSATPSTISGKITYKGETVPTGSLIFQNETGGIYSYGFKDGTYSGSDLPTGDYVVTIETESANPNPNRPKMVQPGAAGKGDPNADYAKRMMERGAIPEGPANAGPYVKIPSKYATKKTSPLKVTLTKGSNTCNFDLVD
jgi:hypothetical protein